MQNMKNAHKMYTMKKHCRVMPEEANENRPISLSLIIGINKMEEDLN
jgi:hypothetical protein